MKKMDKLKNMFKVNNKIIIFLLSLFIIGIVFGSIFVLILKSEDKALVTEYINNFFNNVSSNKLNNFQALKNSLIYNICICILIWLLGISVIGIPIIVFIFFSKAFSLGFAITSIIYNYKFKGVLISLIYIFPHQIINIILMTFLLIYSLSLSIKIILSLIKKKVIDFKPIFNKYSKVLLIVVIGFMITSIYEAYLLPKILKLLLNIIR